ncbi:MAG: hypothetical protein IPO19_21135 [Rhodoferax sp.]|nr:hypothetical protein [Rhodoferax sp.]
MKPTAALLATAVALHLTCGHAVASERDGVACPNGTDASVSDGVLRCSITLEFMRMSMCPRLDFPNYTQIELRGVDQCKPQGVPLHGKASVDSAMTPMTTEPRLVPSNRPISDVKVLATTGLVLPIPPADSAYQRRTDQISQDRFVAQQTIHFWPIGMPLSATVGHDPRNGVTCPTGFATELLDNRRRLRCMNADVRKAGCDAVNPLNPLSPWAVERRSGRDLCVSKDITGNRVVGQYTIPTGVGYVGALGNPASHGWTLDTDRSGHGNVDYWVNKVAVLKYPVAR